MRKILLLFFFAFVFILSFPQEEYVFDPSFLSDSIYDDLNDFSSFISEEMKDEILLLIKSKDDVTYKKIFEITSNEFVSKIIYEKFYDRERNLSITCGIYNDSLISSRIKTFAKETYKSGDIKEFVLMEKDIGEEKFYDNIKAGISYSSFIFGNYRIKTGRGLFSDYSDYFSISDLPFYSDKYELNATYDEYPAYFGGSLSKFIGSAALTGFISYDFYDSRVDSLGEVIKILKYNLHDDSLSISRENNLKALTLGFVGRYHNQIANMAFSYTSFSRVLSENKGKNLYVLSFFGKKNILSYDIAYSHTNGLAISCGLKKNLRSSIFNSGFLIDIGFYNPHSKTFVEKESFHSGFAEISMKLPMRVKEKIEYVHKDETKIDNRIEIAMIKNMDFTYKTSIDEKIDHSFILTLKGYIKDFVSLKNSYSIKSTGTYTVRADVMIMSNIIKSYLFGYYCNVSEDDIVTLYGYSLESIYPLHTYYEGESYLFGFLMQNANSSKLKYDLFFSYDLSSRFKTGLSLTIIIL